MPRTEVMHVAASSMTSIYCCSLHYRWLWVKSWVVCIGVGYSSLIDCTSEMISMTMKSMRRCQRVSGTTTLHHSVTCRGRIPRILWSDGDYSFSFGDVVFCRLLRCARILPVQPTGPKEVAYLWKTMFNFLNYFKISNSRPCAEDLLGI